MKEILKVDKKNEVLSLITGITFSHVPAWYGATMRDLKMDVICPKARVDHSPCPAIVWICGGAYMVVDRSVWMPEMVRFAREGYVVAGIEYRTSNEAVFPAQLADVKSAIRFLKKHAEEFCIDPSQIFVMGESAGGALASLAGVTARHREYDIGDFLEYDSTVAGVVDFYGPTSVQEELKVSDDPESLVPYWTMDAYLGSGYSREQYRKCCAESYLDELETAEIPPFMILQGTDDQVVPMELSERFYDRLMEKGADAECILVEGAAHGDDLLYQDEVAEHILQFLKRIRK